MNSHDTTKLAAAPRDPKTTAGTAQVIALSELHGNASEDGAPEDAPLLGRGHPLHQVKASLQVCIGSATLTVEELLSAREHQVLRLDRQVQQPVDLLLEGQVVARGELVAVDGHFGVRITELPVSLSLAAKS